VLVELRQGIVGSSKVFDSKHLVGHSGTVNFSNMCAGTYFIAIGNGSTVAVGPVRYFTDSQYIHTNVRVTSSQGNIGTMNRRNL